jgi:site-specific DNA recombinase
LDAQKDKLIKYADYQDMVVVREFSDEGKSGKNVEGRPQFKEMLDLIEAGTDDIDFVLVFKLSRFGRNAADVLGSLQKMQDYGVNLICVEDGIDSSKDAGKLMISVLSAVAEIERENILVQTMEGRKQKAREGKWNGGFAPYGYKLVDGELKIADDEVEVIKIIFDKYINTTMGVAAIAAFLNESGYVKKKRQNNTIDGFAASFVKGVIDNPVYCGKISYGRRKTEKIQGKRNFLIAFDKLYDKFSDAEKKEFMGTFVESVELYPECLGNGKFLKHIHFKLPVYYNGTVIDDISWENEGTVETVVLMSRVEGK